MKYASQRDVLNLFREALADVISGKINPMVFCIIANGILRPQAVNANYLAWARQRLLELRTAEQRNEAVNAGQICPSCDGKGHLEWQSLVIDCRDCNGTGHI